MRKVMMAFMTILAIMTIMTILSGDASAQSEIIVAADGSGDYTSIQSGLNNLPTEGGTVLVKAGNYIVASSITLPAKPVVLKDFGDGEVIISTTTPDMHLITLNGGTTRRQDITIEGFHLIGEGTASWNSHGISVYKSDRITIRDMIIEGVGGCGIRASESTDMSIENCEFFDTGKHGISLEGSTTTGNTIIDSVAHHTGLTGFMIANNAHHNEIMDCTAHDVYDNGFYVDVGCDYNLVKNCRAHGNDNKWNGGGSGILVKGNYVTVEGCECWENRGGIGLSLGASYCNITNNHVYNNTQDNIAINGQAGGTDNNYINWNLCEGSKTRNGIDVSSGDNYNIVEHNTLRNNAMYDLSFLGSYNTATDNYYGTYRDIGTGNIIEPSLGQPDSKKRFSGRLTDANGNPLQASVSIGSATNSTDSQGNYLVAIPSGTYDVRYNIPDLHISDYFVIMPSIEVQSDISDLLHSLTDYPSQNKISLTVDNSRTQTVQTHSPEKPNRVLIGGIQANEVGSLPSLTEGTWYYDSVGKKVHVKISSPASEEEVVIFETDFESPTALPDGTPVPPEYYDQGLGNYGTFANAYYTTKPISGSKSLYLYNNNPKDTSIFCNFWIPLTGGLEKTMAIEFDFKIRNKQQYSLSYQALGCSGSADTMVSGWLQYCWFPGWDDHAWTWNYWDVYYGNFQESAFSVEVGEEEVHRIKLVMDFQNQRYLGYYWDGVWTAFEDWDGYPQHIGTGTMIETSPLPYYHPQNTLRVALLLDSRGGDMGGTGAVEMWIDNLKVTEIV